MSIKGFNTAHWNSKTRGLGALKSTATNIRQGPTASPCSHRSHRSLSPYSAAKDKQTLHGQRLHHHHPPWCHTASAQFLVSLALYGTSARGAHCTVLLGTAHNNSSQSLHPSASPWAWDTEEMSSASAGKIHLRAWRGDCGPKAKLASVLLSCHFLCVQSRTVPSWWRLCRTAHTGTGMCDSRRKA